MDKLTWDFAKEWEQAANKDKNGDEVVYSPKWGFDCGFKLDFDGPLFSVSSRFYPSGEGWSGKLVLIATEGRRLKEWDFIAGSLNELKGKVEDCLKNIKISIE